MQFSTGIDCRSVGLQANDVNLNRSQLKEINAEYSNELLSLEDSTMSRNKTLHLKLNLFAFVFF